MPARREKMRALVYRGPRDVRLEEKPRPKLEAPEDAIVRVTATAICGSDLHLYHGTVPGMEPGQTLGHEFVGVVDEVGPEVHEVKVGDRVAIPFNIDCGRCWYCRNGLWSQCDRSNPNGKVGGAYGYSQELGGYDGGQAEYVRVPYANTNPLKLPRDVPDEQAVFLCDVFPTGYFAADIANVMPGDDVVVFGAGPVGYFAALSSLLRGAAQVQVVDHWPRRLEKVAEIGAIPVNFDEEDPVKEVKKATRDAGAVCIDAVGYEAVGHEGHGSHRRSGNPAYEPNDPAQIFTWIAEVGRKYTTVGIPGVYAAPLAQFPIEKLFQNELQLRMGQCPVKRYNERLLHLIETGRVDPSRLLSHTMRLAEAPDAYALWDQKEEATKILLKP
jgi:S-(hydroxymethyl)glutathione dehydrogenase/alcohol dehydrogenase